MCEREREKWEKRHYTTHIFNNKVLMFDWYLNRAQFHGLSNGLNMEWIKNRSSSNSINRSTVKPIFKRNDIAMHKLKKKPMEIIMIQEWKEKQCHFNTESLRTHDAYNNKYWNEFNSLCSKKDWWKTNSTMK